MQHDTVNTTRMISPYFSPSVPSAAPASNSTAPRPILFVSSTFSPPTSFFHPLVTALSSQLDLRFSAPASPSLSSCCEMFGPGHYPAVFLVLAASSGSTLSSLTACDDIDRRVERLKAAHKECIIVVLDDEAPHYDADLKAAAAKERNPTLPTEWQYAAVAQLLRQGRTWLEQQIQTEKQWPLLMWFRQPQEAAEFIVTVCLATDRVTASAARQAEEDDYYALTRAKLIECLEVSFSHLSYTQLNELLDTYGDMESIAAAVKEPKQLTATMAWDNEQDALRLYKTLNETDYVPAAAVEQRSPKQQREEVDVLVNQTRQHDVPAASSEASDSAPVTEQHSQLLAPSLPILDDSYFRARDDSTETEMTTYTSNTQPTSPSPTPLRPAASPCTAYDDLDDEDAPLPTIQLPNTPLPALHFRLPIAQPVKSRTYPPYRSPVEVKRSHAAVQPAGTDGARERVDVDERKVQLHKRHAGAPRAGYGRWSAPLVSNWQCKRVDSDDSDGDREEHSNIARNWDRQRRQHTTERGKTGMGWGVGRENYLTDGGKVEVDEVKEGNSVTKQPGRWMQRKQQMQMFQKTGKPEHGWW